jgi:hypothetical protein
MKYLQIILLKIFFCLVVFAQEKGPSLRKHLAIKVAPLYLVSLDNSLQFMAEHRINSKNHVSLTEEFGYGNGAQSVYDDSFVKKNKDTWRARVELRKYRNSAPMLSGRYLSYEFSYKNVTENLERNVGRECENGNCNFFEKISYPATKNVFVANIKFGKQIILNDRLTEKNNLIFDIYAGFGIRKVNINHSVDIGPNSFSREYYTGLFSGESMGSEDRKYLVPNLNMGFSIGWVVF